MQCIAVKWSRALLWMAWCLGLFIAPAGAEDLAAKIRLKHPVTLCGEAVPLDDPQVAERFEKEMLLSLGDQPQLILWLKRSTRYFPYIEKMLAQRHMPDDLKYLAVAESALRMHAGSSKGAMGVWQLVAPTARKYGLQVDDAIDERRNPYLSTPAALAYLIDLYDQFASWTLSLAAYNMGEERLKAEILEQGISDYYRLYLSLETQRFIFRVLAIKTLLQTPKGYGISLAAADYYPPEAFVAVTLNEAKDLPLRLIAKAAHTDFKAIKDLNPELRGYYLTTSNRAVNVPPGGEVGFQERLIRLIETDARLKSQRLYVVQKGDSLSGIAKKFDVPVTSLLIWNRIGIHHMIHPGQHLVVYAPNRKPDIETKESDNNGEG